MSSPHLSDEDRLRALSQGLPVDLEPLLRTHGPAVLTLLGLLCNAAERRDRCFVALPRQLWTQRFDYPYPKPSRLWLYRTAVRVTRQTPESAAVPHPLATIPSVLREVLVLRSWGRLSYPDIAFVVEASEASVRSFMQQALFTVRTSSETPRL